MLPGGVLLRAVVLLAATLSPGAAAPAARAAAGACAPALHPLVAEVLYDAAGDDTGWEFVELFNPHDRALSLAGARLEAGDGSAAGRWTLRWTANAGDSVAARGRFVVGGAKVQPPPQALVTLELQNGPDAVRLVWPDGAVEVVGYGAQEFAEYFCGAPAADAAPGWSLARLPDDADLGGNALDFQPATPSPGRANRPGRDLAVVAGSLALAPEQPGAGAAARLAARLANRGGTPVAAGEAALFASASAGEVTLPLVSRVIAGALEPGDTLALDEQVALPAGKWRLRLAAGLAGDEATGNDADSLLVRVGPGPLEVTEIQFHPVAGEGEWVEVRNRSGAPLEPAGFTLSDRGTARGVPSGGEGALEPESLAVLAQERDALLAAFAGLDARRVWRVSPWPALNNGDDSTGVADAVVLREADGTPCARVPYSAGGVPAGVPLEWSGGSWQPASDPRGTPLAPPRLRPPLVRRFVLGPRRVAPGGAGRLEWDLPWPRARLSLDLYDLAGRPAARVLAERAVAARGECAWTAPPVAPGVYVALARARPETGTDAPVSEARALRVEGAAR